MGKDLKLHSTDLSLFFQLAENITNIYSPLSLVIRQVLKQRRFVCQSHIKGLTWPFLTPPTIMRCA